jgi:hypothetical protein
MKNDDQQSDASLAIDLLLQRDPAAADGIRQRLQNDPQFRKTHQDVANALAALDLLPEHQPPDNLVAATMARIRQAKQMDALLAREEIARGRPTLRMPLREIGGVAAAVIVLAMLLLPSVRQVGTVAKQAQCLGQAGQIGAGLMTYAVDNGGYLPVASTRVARWLPGNQQPVASNSAALFRLVKGGHVPAQAFVCPSTDRCVVYPAACLNDFPGPQFVTYSYQHSVDNPLKRNDFMGPADRMAILADANPLFRDGAFQRQRSLEQCSDNHNRGQNVLYLDGQARWTDRPTVGVANNNIFIAEGISDYTGVEKPVSATDTFLLPPYTGGGQP